MKKFVTIVLTAAGVLGLASIGFAQSMPTINEVVVNDVSTDDMEFVEICWEPDQDLSAFTIVVIEGEGSGKGLIDRAFGLTGLVGPSGLYVLGDAAVTCADQTKTDTIENGGETILLVRNFTGAVGQDIDADDDGVADGGIGMIVDGIGFALPSAGDATYYGVPTLGPDTGNDGTSNFDVAGAARCGDCDGDWGMICLDGTEVGDPDCDINNAFNPYVVTHATPCEANACGTISVEETSWGTIKAGYR